MLIKISNKENGITILNSDDKQIPGVQKITLSADAETYSYYFKAELEAVAFINEEMSGELKEITYNLNSKFKINDLSVEEIAQLLHSGSLVVKIKQ